MKSLQKNYIFVLNKIGSFLIKFLYLLAALPLILTISVNCHSLEVAKKNHHPEIVTKITSKSIHVKRKSGIIELREDVVMEQEDISLTANLVNVYYEENSTSNKIKKTENQLQSVKMIKAENNVKIFNQDFSASGKIGYYYPNKRIFIIEGDVLLNKGTSVAKGDKFFYDLNKKDGKLTGQSKILNPNNNLDNEDKRTTVIINDEEINK